MQPHHTPKNICTVDGGKLRERHLHLQSLTKPSLFLSLSCQVQITSMVNIHSEDKKSLSSIPSIVHAIAPRLWGGVSRSSEINC